MTADRRRLALRAATRAYALRASAGIALDSPLCVYDVAEDRGVEVRFADVPSMEGIYYPSKPAIVISSLRPPGRQAFTCAHELGHHIYGHGEQFDELVEDRGTRKYDSKEFEADCFAGALLMPKTAVLRGLSARSIRLTQLCPKAAYRVASWLGVGYTTLIHHMGLALNLIPRHEVESLTKVKLPAIRRELLSFECPSHLIVADEAWCCRPIDAGVSDVIKLPPDAQIEGAVADIVHRDDHQCVLRAVAPGIGRVFRPNISWAHYLRVSPKEFSGMARFRHLEEVEDE